MFAENCLKTSNVRTHGSRMRFLPPILLPFALLVKVDPAKAINIIIMEAKFVPWIQPGE